ncbi:Uncharacterised protein [Vibrio cholerae]|nr:Uncharacterised protein [Vibrio cholerae]
MACADGFALLQCAQSDPFSVRHKRVAFQTWPRLVDHC